MSIRPRKKTAPIVSTGVRGILTPKNLFPDALAGNEQVETQKRQSRGQWERPNGQAAVSRSAAAKTHVQTFEADVPLPGTCRSQTADKRIDRSRPIPQRLYWARGAHSRAEDCRVWFQRGEDASQLSPSLERLHHSIARIEK